MAKKPINVEKLSLKELLNKSKSREETEVVELYVDDPDKNKRYKRYRTPRDQMINSRGMEYTRPLATDPEVDAKYQELAREFVNNGFDQAKAYATVYGRPLKQSWTPAEKIFNSTGMKSKIREILLGTGEDYDDLPKSYLIERLMQMIDSNILDYIADDGTVLSIRELRALPPWTQTLIKTLESWVSTRLIAVKDENGMVVKDDDGRPHYVEVKDQRVKIELYDKLKAMDTLAKAMKWITSNTEIKIGIITSDVMMKANARIKQLRRDTIEGTTQTTTAD